MSFSSCFALGVGSHSAAKRYNEAEARSRAEAAAEPEAAVTPPPLVPFEPVRTPLRPKDR